MCVCYETQTVEISFRVWHDSCRGSVPRRYAVIGSAEAVMLLSTKAVSSARKYQAVIIGEIYDEIGYIAIGIDNWDCRIWGNRSCPAEQTQAI